MAPKLAIIVTLSSDIVLLLIMLVRILRWRLEAGDGSSLSCFFWTQGILWLLLATIGHLPPAARLVIFLHPSSLILSHILEMDVDELDSVQNISPTRPGMSVELRSFYTRRLLTYFHATKLFGTPALVTLSIAATRMYRTLIDFGSRDIFMSIPKSSGSTGSENNLSGGVPIRFDRMEVFVHTSSEQYPASHWQLGHYDSHVIGLLGDKPQELRVEDGVDNGVGK
ncbi:hypothetical protein BC827DRAFT_1272176 [Russula dissimulans]|nr:hypothetical protein BC827DRAFT_1272176 [Russula dissimulans]